MEKTVTYTTFSYRERKRHNSCFDEKKKCSYFCPIKITGNEIEEFSLIPYAKEVIKRSFSFTKGETF